jgi:hypothetical protein
MDGLVQQGPCGRGWLAGASLPRGGKAKAVVRGVNSEGAVRVKIADREGSAQAF